MRFHVLDQSNSARVAINDALGRKPSEEVITMNTPGAIAYACYSFARRNSIELARVQYAVKVGG